MRSGRIAEGEAIVGERLGQNDGCTVFDERQAAGFERVQAFLVMIVDIDPHAGFGERQHQRNADMARTADDGDIGIFNRGGHVGGDTGPHRHRSFSPLISTNGRNSLMMAMLNTTLSMKL